MDKQIDPMSEEPHDQLDQQASISADPRDAAPGVKQTPQETPPINRPADTPDTSVDQQGRQDQAAVQTQGPQRNAADMAGPPVGKRLSPDGPSVEAGDARPGPNAAPTRPAERLRPGEVQPVPLLSADVAGAFLARWDKMQAEFVDDPHRVVEQADSLVAEVMQRLAETMAQERTGLERQWAAGDAVSTEDLRLALQHYRSFFQRLLSA